MSIIPLIPPANTDVMPIMSEASEYHVPLPVKGIALVTVIGVAKAAEANRRREVVASW
jgi:hypothetical protein